jgi:preprotein translocase subunit Sec63
LSPFLPLFLLLRTTVLIDLRQRLTDDDTRKNFEEFGHPDGKQSFTMGVALPKGLVEGNGFFVLSFYALAFGLGLPYFIVSCVCLFDDVFLMCIQ